MAGSVCAHPKANVAINNVRDWPAYSGSNGEVHQQAYQEMAGIASGAFFSRPLQQERKTENAVQVRCRRVQN